MKFSVLLPTRNRKALLARAIETVRRQDYDNWEIIVSDNFSEEDIAEYISSLSDHRIKYYRTESFIPVTENWNNALSKSDGDYVIMLGDDDCLLAGYFSTLRDVVERYMWPDFVYTNALLYAYPDVMPNTPAGFLKNYNQRILFKDVTDPYVLDCERAHDLVKQSLDFRVMFDYNMQFSLVSRNLINKMSKYGDFYQSPYPDYYASNAIMLWAKTIVVVPRPCVAIGISPKSFGFYYFNDEEEGGNAFLKNIPSPDMLAKLMDIILPGSQMNTSWLISMETLVKNFSNEYGIRVTYNRYRQIQICTVFASYLSGNVKVDKLLKKITDKASLTEVIRFYLYLKPILNLMPNWFRLAVSHKISSRIDSHPAVDMPEIDGHFNTILDVFNQVNPDD